MCLSSLYVVGKTRLPVYLARVSMSHQSLNTDPMSCMWIDYFSRLWQLGAGVSLPASADSCSIPSSCPLTLEPCVPSTSPEYQHSCSYLALSSQAASISLHPCLSARFSFSPKRNTLFICCTFAPLLCLCFPSSQLSARALGGYKLHHCRVRTLLYRKHLTTFLYLETLLIIHHQTH